MSLNKVILIGNVGRDPEVRYFDSGAAVANFPLATSERGYTVRPMVRLFRNVRSGTMWSFVVIWFPLLKNG